MWTDCLMATKTLTRICEKDRCREPRAIVEIRGSRKRARTCVGHLAPALKPYVIETQGKERPQSRDGLCNAIRTKHGGKPCDKHAGWGTDHVGYGKCKLHGGSHRNGRMSAAKEEASAQAVLVMGMPIDVEPTEAVLQCIRISAGEVIYASKMIASLQDTDAVVEKYEVKTRPLKGAALDGEDPDTTVEEVTRSNDARLNIWITTRQQAMDRVTRYSKMAHDMGIADRRVELAEKIGGMMGRMIQSVLDQLELTAVQRQRAPEIVRRELTLIEGSARELETPS